MFCVASQQKCTKYTQAQQVLKQDWWDLQIKEARAISK